VPPTEGTSQQKKKFTWRATSFDQLTLTILLEFESPLDISAEGKSLKDSIVVRVVHPHYFKTQTAQQYIAFGT
jgi:hypothetical protein